jgi:hypothetical protein
MKNHYNLSKVIETKESIQLTKKGGEKTQTLPQEIQNILEDPENEGLM